MAAVDYSGASLVAQTIPASFDNMGGLIPFIYYAPIAYFTDAGIPTKDTSPSSLSDIVTQSTAFEFNTDMGFVKMAMTDETCQLEIAFQGERDAISTMSTLTVSRPLISAEMMGLITIARNGRAIILCEDHEGKVYTLGSRHAPARLDPATKHTTGTASADAQKSEIVFTSSADVLIYTGTIQLKA